MANLELAVVQNCQAQLEKGAKKTVSMKDNNNNNNNNNVSNNNIEDSRRDEWSTEAINNLLDVYEAKWNHRNRGNLKGGDWEDVAMRVSARGGGGKSAKSPFQCKNKVASMKQKYRSETLLQGINGSAVSRWPFFARMDLMLRRPNPSTNGSLPSALPPPPEAAPPPEFRLPSGDSDQEVARLGGGGGGVLVCNAEEQGNQHGHGELQGNEHPHKHECLSNENPEHQHDNNATHENSEQNQDDDDASNTLPHQTKALGAESDDNTSTPRSKLQVGDGGVAKGGVKHRKYLSKEVAASIRSFADSILKLERAKMEMFKDSERIRAEMEARRVDMELKRTEIIMNTQLEIAKLLSGKGGKKKLKKKCRLGGGNGGVGGASGTTSTAVAMGTQHEGSAAAAAPSPSRNGVSVVSVSVGGLNFADYVSNGSQSQHRHNGNNVQQSSMASPPPPPVVPVTAMQASSHAGPPPPPPHHYAPTAMPVSVVQPIPALQFMASPASQPKPD